MNCRLFLGACVLSLAGCGGLRVDHSLDPGPGDWPMFARDGQRSGATTPQVRPPLHREWEQDVSAGIGNGSPVIVGSVVFVATLRGELYGFDVATGTGLGSSRFGEAIQGSPVIDSTTAYVALSNTRESLAAYDFVSGKVRWKRNYGDLEASPLLYNHRLYVGNTSGVFVCVDPGTGEQIWKFELPANRRMSGVRSSAAAESSRIVFGGEDGFLYALQADSGSLCWKYDTGSPVTATPLITAGMAFAGNRRGIVTAIGCATGKLIWRFDAGAPVFANPVRAGDLTLVATIAGRVIGVRTRDGSPAWSVDLGGPVSAGGAVAGDVAYFGTLRKEIYALDPLHGTILWKGDAGGRVHTSPAVANGRVFIATDNRVVIAFREAPR